MHETRNPVYTAIPYKDKDACKLSVLIFCLIIYACLSPHVVDDSCFMVE